jgi:outer membrane protein TolC
MKADVKARHYKVRASLLTVVLGAIFMFVSDGRSQSAIQSKLDLETAVVRALAINPQAKITDSRTKIAESRIREAKTGKMPFAQFSQSVIRSNNPVFVFGSLLEQGRFGAANFAIDSLNNPKGLTNLRSLVEVKMPIFDQWQSRSRVAEAEIGRDQSTLQAEAVRQKIRFDIVSTFYGVILRREMVRVSEQALRSADANRKKAKDMADVGMTTDADFLAAEVELANAGQQKLEAESELITTIAALNLMVGDKPELDRELKGDLQEKYFPIDDQDALIRTALDDRPDYKMAELAIKNSRVQTKSIKDLKLPRVDAFGNFGYSSPYVANGSTDYTVGVSLTYTLFDAGHKSRVEQVAEAETVAGAEKQVLSDQIRLGVVRAFQNFKTARAKIQVSITSITQADEALRIVQDRYKSGLTTFNEVLRSEAALTRAKQSLLTARYDYYVSYAAVLLATGRLSDVRLFD